MLETITQATAVLQDESAAEKARVDAAHYLGKYGSEETAYILVAALDEDDYGVHWAASEGLAQLGDAAMPALLKALVSSTCTPRVVYGAKHAFHTSGSSNVRMETKDILHTIHGSRASITTMQAASALMQKLSIH